MKKVYKLKNKILTFEVRRTTKKEFVQGLLGLAILIGVIYYIWVQFMDIEKIVKEVLDSDTAYSLSKETGINVSQLQRYKNKERKIENMTIKNAQKLLDYMKKKDVSKQNFYGAVAGQFLFENS